MDNSSRSDLIQVKKSIHFGSRFALISSKPFKRFLISLFTCLVSLFFAVPTNAQKTISGFSDSAQMRAIAENAVAAVDQSGKWVEQLQPSDLNELPIGLSEKINNITYKLAVSNVAFQSTYAELTIFARVEIPQAPYTLYFGINGLKLSYEGGIIGDAKLLLLGDVNIPIGGNATVKLKGGFNIQTGTAIDGLTYITMDCKGFKEMGLAAEVSFPRSVLIPCNSNGDKIEGQVKADFKTVVSDWNDILVNIDLPAFQINKLDDIVFKVKNATFDFSDARNSSGILFPVGYQTRYLNNYPNESLWRGIYAQNIEVMLPPAFQRKGSTQRISFGSQNLIIDNNGVSGNFFGKNILGFNEGNASGWKFSVDQFNVGIEANHLVAAGFQGNIGLPVADKDSLRYEAVITQDNQYWLTVAPKGKMDFKLWQAKAELDSNSYVKMMVADGKFLPEANLYGKITIDAKTKETSTKPIAQFQGVAFRGLRLKTQDPYLSVDYFGYNGQIKLANFPASIDSIVLVANGHQADLSFGLKVTLHDQAFKAETRLNLSAGLQNNNGQQSWQFDKVRISRIQINDAEIGGMKLSGGIDILEDDPVYGDGFGGNISATFTSLKAAVKVRALFGKTTYRYWFVEGSAQWPTSIPIVPPLQLKGFAGGAYYRMLKTSSGSGSSFSQSVTADYRPDSVMGLGIKAGILFTAGSESVMDGMAQFEVAFSASGGMKYIGLFGNAKFLGKLPGPLGSLVEKSEKLFTKISDKVSGQLKGLSDAMKLDKINAVQKLAIEDKQAAAMEVPADEKPENSNGVSAYMGMSYDFDNSTFHANFSVYVNAAKGLLQGIDDNYRAGWAVLHFAPDDWYIHIGTPTKPIGIRFGLGPFSIKTSSYLMVGHHIPASPPPPQEVADILGVDLKELDYMRDANAMGEGRGFAFGSNVKVETGDITFLIMYANLKAGVGFDLMLKEYKGITCEGSNEPIGINGWYANAQAYGYFQGEIGVKINLLFIKLRVPVIKGGAAALLQAKLPNPSWFQGYIGLNVSVLGLINGRLRFKVTLGNECKFVRADGKENVLGMNVIADVTPKDTTNVNVFTAPQVALNFPVGKDIRIPTDQGDQVFRVKLEKFELYKNNTSIAGKLEWNTQKDAVSFYSTEILPPNTALKAYAKVSFMELKNGSWQTVYVNGAKAEEDRTLNFITGSAPKDIPLGNIVYSYPVVDQRNFYISEYNQGYVQLKFGQAYLFTNIPGYKTEIRVKRADGVTTASLPFRYDSAACRLMFNMYGLDKSQSYTLELTGRKLDASTSVASNTISKQSVGDESEIEVTTNKAQDITRDDLAQVLLTYKFNTSRYARFAEKINSLSYRGVDLMRVGSDAVAMTPLVSDGEPFETVELTGTKYTADQPLVQPAAIMQDDYFMKDLYPLAYKEYPLAGTITFNTRDTALLGFYPSRAITISTTYLSVVNANQLNDPYLKQRLPYIYDLPRVYRSDFRDIQSQVVNRFLGTPQQARYNYLINGYFPFIRSGDYKVIYQYVLPGNQKGSAATVTYPLNLF